MKSKIINYIIAALIVCISNSASAQTTTTNKPAFIKGGIEIRFNTRTQVDEKGKPNPGVTDLYKLNLNVSDSAHLIGEIIHTPVLFSSLLGRESQSAKLEYKINTGVVNPAKASDVRMVGRLTGQVPIDGKGVYRFTDGTLRIGVDAIGKAQGFTSKFSGLAAGKPPKSDSLAARIKKEAVKISREVNGKKVALVVNDYDKMSFSGHVLAAGPVQTYPEVQVNGEMLYDYERLAWYFQNVSLAYLVDGKAVTDKLTGNIRWVESPQRKTNGEGEYQFDVRVNEPESKAGESAVFATASDESSFFEADSGIASLVGTMKYKDTMAGDDVTQSVVTIDLTGNKISRLQVMNLCKLVIISCAVPMNSE